MNLVALLVGSTAGLILGALRILGPGSMTPAILGAIGTAHALTLVVAVRRRGSGQRPLIGASPSSTAASAVRLGAWIPYVARTVPTSGNATRRAVVGCGPCSTS